MATKLDYESTATLSTNGSKSNVSDSYEAAWMTWPQFKRTINGKRVIFFGVSDDWTDKTIRKSNPNLTYLVDNSPVMIGSEFRGREVKHPSVLLEREEGTHVVITAGAYDSIAPQLLEYGLRPGVDFTISPALNNLKVITDLHTHQAELLISSPDHKIYSELDQARDVGGGLYVYRTGDNHCEKVLDGTFHQMVETEHEYFVTDEQRGVCRVSKDFELIACYATETGDYAHGVAYCPQRRLVFIGQSGLDRVTAYHVDTKEVAFQIYLSSKHAKYGRAQHWLNDLCVHGDYLYVSMFSHSGAYLNGVYDGGILQIDLDDTDNRTVLCRDAWMPHTVRFFDSQMCFLDSMNGKLFHSLTNVVGEFPGFVRGLAYDGTYYYIGQSESRQFELLQGIKKHIAMTAGFYMFDEVTKAAKFFVVPQVRQIHDMLVMGQLS